MEACRLRVPGSGGNGKRGPIRSRRSGWTLYAFAVCLAVLSGLAHSLWNLFAKRSGDKAVFLWVMSAPSTLLLLPVLLCELAASELPAAAWAGIALSLAVQVCSAKLLVLSYRLGDLSQVYPVMRGTVVLAAPVTGTTLFGETLTLRDWAGILIIFAGVLTMGFGGGGGNSGSGGKASAARGWKPLLAAAATGLCITAYLAADKFNLRYLSPWSVLEIANIGYMIPLTPAVFSAGRFRKEWRASRTGLLWAFALPPAAFFFFLFAIRSAPLSLISPVREIALVFAALFGILILKEGRGAVRLLASLLILSGVFVVQL